ncbi:MAG: RNA polymerase sigma-70 factor [Agriterribacter sp.]
MPAELPTYNEDELRLQLVQGNEEAFTRIVYHYYPRLLPFTIKITKTKYSAEEIVQEVFLRLWQKREDMARIEQLGAWLFRVAANLALTWLKRSAMEGNILQQLQPSQNNPVQEYLDFRQSTEQLRAAVDQLPEQQKKIFRLSKEEGLSNQEIADRMSLSVNTVKNHLTRALQTLRDNLGSSNLLLLCMYIIQQTVS